MKHLLHSIARAAGFLMVFSLAGFLFGCTPLHATDEYQIIGPSETAFLVPLEGNNLKSQGSLNSEAYVEKSKIAAKSVIIKHHTLDTCPDCPGEHSAKWIDVPDALLYKVNRAFVSRTWTASAGTGTSPANQAFHVEDDASIDFWVGASAVAHIDEADAAKFLYRNAGKQLEVVMDTTVRNLVSAKLSEICGAKPLNWIRPNKGSIFKEVVESIRPLLKDQGITLDSLGASDGLTYSDPNVQDAINKKFAADMSVQESQSRKQAAEVMAQAGPAAMQLQEMDLRRRELDLKSTMLAKWNGVLPLSVSGEVDPFSAFGLASVRKLGAK
jgi:hypothetical protein